MARRKATRKPGQWDADMVRERLALHWPDAEYLAIDEAPEDSSNNGSAIDRLVIALWPSRGLGLEGVEIKISLHDWRREIREASKAEWWWQHVNRYWVAVPSNLAEQVRSQLPATWGLISCPTNGKPIVIVEAPEHEAQPLPWAATVGILRAAAGSGAKALLRAELRGRDKGRKEGKAAGRVTAAVTTGEKPALIPQPHGGALAAGGTPGNNGGRPRSEFRALMMGDALDARAEFVKRIGMREPCPECGRRMSDADVSRWFDTTAKYGPGPAKSSLDPAIVSEMAAAVLRHADISDEAMQAIYRDWSLTLGRHAAGEG